MIRSGAQVEYGCLLPSPVRVLDNGLQVVMFMHQDAAVWADLTMILWAAGLRDRRLRIVTETESGTKEGKSMSRGPCCWSAASRPAVTRSLLWMRSTTAWKSRSAGSRRDARPGRRQRPELADADYQLAAYAAAAGADPERPIEEINPEREITRVRPKVRSAPSNSSSAMPSRSLAITSFPRASTARCGRRSRRWKALSQGPGGGNARRAPQPV